MAVSRRVGAVTDWLAVRNEVLPWISSLSEACNWGESIADWLIFRTKIVSYFLLTKGGFCSELGQRTVFSFLEYENKYL